METKYSEAELFVFLDYLASKGLINGSTINSRKAAASKILSALDDHEKIDLRDIDREQTFQRFSNKFGKEFTPESLITYKSRFNTALNDFLRYLDNPSGFKAGKPKKSAKENTQDISPSKKRKTGSPPPILPKVPEIPQDEYVVSVPIRNGLIVKINNLPMDLTKSEAQRICAVVTALSVTVNLKEIG